MNSGQSSLRITLNDSPFHKSYSNNLSQYSVSAEKNPSRANVPPSYVKKHEGKPFRTPLRPDQGFRDGSDAYHAAPSADELLLEITREPITDEPNEYIGLLARHDPDHPSRNILRECKWIPTSRSRPLPSDQAIRDLAMQRSELLERVYEGVEARRRANPAERRIASQANSVLADYLGNFSANRFAINDDLGFPDQKTDVEVYEAVQSTVEAGRRQWAPRTYFDMDA